MLQGSKPPILAIVIRVSICDHVRLIFALTSANLSTYDYSRGKFVFWYLATMVDKSTTTPSTSKTKPTYISSSGQTLDSIPFGARLNRLSNDIYNFLGLYFVSLLSLDPYTAAQNSRFNTRGPGRQTQPASRTTGAGVGGLFGGGRLGGGGSGPGSGPSGGSGGGRRMGTVDDVRGPECGSCPGPRPACG